MAAALHLIDGDDVPPAAHLRHAPPRRLVAELPVNARLLLWAMRLLGESRGNWTIVQQELWLCCGLASVESVLQALEDLLAVLARDGRRPLLLKPSDARRMTACEEAIVALLDAARDGDGERLAAHARWLAPPLAQGPLCAFAVRFARGFPAEMPAAACAEA
ncbi:MAG: hypothetical protein ACK4NA_08880 [Alphaproteobacteria bacterium]